MYMTVVTSAIAAQRVLASSYVASGRATEFGLLMLVQQKATLSYFARVVPPDGLQAVHAAFLTWQRTGINELAADLRQRNPRAAGTAASYADASRALAEALRALPKAASPTDG